MSNFKDLVRLGKDAITRHTQAGKAVTGFSAALDTGWGDNKKTIWLDCSAWGDRYVKLAEYLTKGSQIVVEGDIGTREYEGKTYVTLDVRDIKLVAGKRDDAGGGAGRAAPPESRESGRPPPTDAYDSDDIPF